MNLHCKNIQAHCDFFSQHRVYYRHINPSLPFLKSFARHAVTPDRSARLVGSLLLLLLSSLWRVPSSAYAATYFSFNFIRLSLSFCFSVWGLWFIEPLTDRVITRRAHSLQVDTANNVASHPLYMSLQRVYVCEAILFLICLAARVSVRFDLSMVRDSPGMGIAWLQGNSEGRAGLNCV